MREEWAVVYGIGDPVNIYTMRDTLRPAILSTLLLFSILYARKVFLFSEV